MNWPSVGVVIPTRDRPEMVRKTIAAVRDQHYPGEVKVVVVYDQTEPDYRLASTDGTQVLVLTNWRTSGLAGARNTGILALDTDYVAFCDDDDQWRPDKLRRQAAALLAEPDSEFATCAIEVEYEGRTTARLAGTGRVTIDQLARSRMSMLHSSSFLVRRAALAAHAIGLVAEDAPGSQNEDWDLLLRAARRAPIVHVDEPLVRVLWGRSSHYAYEYATKISSLRWMMQRHPEISGCRRAPPGSTASWPAGRPRPATRAPAWQFSKEAVRANWKEPRTAIALAAMTGAVKVENVLSALHKRGRGI